MLKRFSSILRSETLAQSVAGALVLTILCRLVGFGRGVVLVRMLEPEDLGVWALIANTVQVLALFAAFGIPSGIARSAERQRRDGVLPAFLAQTLGKTVGITALICLAGVLLWEPLRRGLYNDSSNFPIVAVTLAAILATVAFSVIQGFLHGLRLFRLDSLVELLHNIGFLALTVFLVFA